MIVTKHYPFN